jgi:prepilin-type N-terminal cleavage/methylation domain-containing protein
VDKQKSGYTIIEVMIAATIFAIITAGVFAATMLFTRAFGGIGHQADINADVRRVMDQIGYDVKMTRELKVPASNQLQLLVNGETVVYSFRNTGERSLMRKQGNANAIPFSRLVDGFTVNLDNQNNAAVNITLQMKPPQGMGNQTSAQRVETQLVSRGVRFN